MEGGFMCIVRWMSFTPEFQSTIVLVSSPLALLVALWGMTTKSHSAAHSVQRARQGAFAGGNAANRVSVMKIGGKLHPPLPCRISRLPCC